MSWPLVACLRLNPRKANQNRRNEASQRQKQLSAGKGGLRRPPLHQGVRKRRPAGLQSLGPRERRRPAHGAKPRGLGLMFDGRSRNDPPWPGGSRHASRFARGANRARGPRWWPRGLVWLAYRQGGGSRGSLRRLSTRPWVRWCRSGFAASRSRPPTSGPSASLTPAQYSGSRGGRCSASSRRPWR